MAQTVARMSDPLTAAASISVVTNVSRLARLWVSSKRLTQCPFDYVS